MLAVPLLGRGAGGSDPMTTGAADPRAVTGRIDESHEILRSRIDLSRLAPLSRTVTEHVIVASADFDYATDLVCDEEALAAAVAEVATGAVVVVDAAMVAAGITAYPVTCKSDEPLTERLARTAAISSAAAAVRLAFGQVGPGAIWVVGCGAEALEEVISRDVQPSFVIGLPVGFGWWNDVPRVVRPREAAPGWLLTALAISLGAPFWFDMLGKVISIRAANKPDQKAK